MNFADVKAIAIPEGDVKELAIGGVTVWQKPNPLPYDAEVEYVQSSGAQYVDTGLSLASGTFNMTGAFHTAYSSTKYFFGVQGDASSGSTGQKRLLMWQTSAGYSIDRGTSGGRINGTLGADGSFSTGDVGYSITLNTAKPIYVFAANGISSSSNRGIGRLSALKIWDAQDNVRDFIPVRVGSGASAVGYLYDRANPSGGPSRQDVTISFPALRFNPANGREEEAGLATPGSLGERARGRPKGRPLLL